MQVVNIRGFISVFSLRSVNRITECFPIHLQVVRENLQPLMLTDFTSPLQIYIFLYLERVNVSFLEQCSVEKSMVHFNTHANLQYIEYFSDFSSGYNPGVKPTRCKKLCTFDRLRDNSNTLPRFSYLVFVTSTSINATKKHQ